MGWWALGTVMEVPAGPPETGPSLGSGIWLCSFPSLFCKPGHPHHQLPRHCPSDASSDFFDFDLEPSAFWGKTVVLPLKAANLSLILLVELVPRCPVVLSLEACILTFDSSREKVFSCLHPSSHSRLANLGPKTVKAE